MRVRWFGEPWPSAELRAGVCDEDEFRVETPLGRTCIHCGDEVEENDRGILMAASPEIEGAWFEPELGTSVCAEHIDCLLRSTLPDVELPFSRKGN